MKIVSYNIAKCVQAKIDHVLRMNADVYILPECANKSSIQLPAGYDMLWTGDEDIPYKGLGVIWKKEFSIHVVEDFVRIKHHLPLIVDCGDSRIFILACWPTVWKENKTYPQLLLEALHKYGSYLDGGPALAIGDFNCYIGQSNVRKSTGTFEDCIKELQLHGMKSIYHEQNAEELGKESDATFFWRYNEQNPYFLDYAFCNVKPKSFVIGKWERDVSDHRPLIVEL